MDSKDKTNTFLAFCLTFLIPTIYRTKWDLAEKISTEKRPARVGCTMVSSYRG